MAKAFLDVNVIIDILEERKNIQLVKLERHQTYISTLSLHIFLYVEKQSVPYPPLSDFIQNNNLVDFSATLAQKALIGPTDDFEDNIQLHSAAVTDCDIFITSDERLIKMKFFGKTQIISPENLK